jgi:hypothetical protein
MTNELRYIPLDDIVVEKRINDRRYEDDENDIALLQLTRSIEQRGLIQPIIVFQDSGRYVLQNGKRRLRSYKMLRMSYPDNERFATIEAVVANDAFSLIDQLLRILDENIHRKNIYDISFCESILFLTHFTCNPDSPSEDFEKGVEIGRRLYSKWIQSEISNGNVDEESLRIGRSFEEVFEQVGINRNTFKKMMSLTSLHEDILVALQNRNIYYKTAKEINQMVNGPDDALLVIIKEAVQEGWTPHQTKTKIEAYISAAAVTQSKPAYFKEMLKEIDLIGRKIGSVKELNAQQVNQIKRRLNEIKEIIN